MSRYAPVRLPKLLPNGRPALQTRHAEGYWYATLTDDNGVHMARSKNEAIAKAKVRKAARLAQKIADAAALRAAESLFNGANLSDDPLIAELEQVWAGKTSP